MPKQNYPLRHLSIRVPWHDAGWVGTICNIPHHNSACLRLPNIAQKKDDAAEKGRAGVLIEGLPQEELPPCVAERATFMAPFEITRVISHPYLKTSPTTHGHLEPTPFRHPAYSAPAVPFRWMRKETREEIVAAYELGLEPDAEPALPFETGWWQHTTNQNAFLDCFFDHIAPEESLVFFYAKEVPFVESFGRVLVGVGRVKAIGPGVEYKGAEKGDVRSMIWDRAIQHSIRSGYKDGFLLPYHAALEHAETHPEFDINRVVAFAPEDRITEFSFASEHVTHDGAIASLLSLAASLTYVKDHLPGPWDQCLRWLDDRLTELWSARGPYPGLGAVLTAFGIETGSLVAHALASRADEKGDLWGQLEQTFKDPTKSLPAPLAKRISKTLQKTWNGMSDERRRFFKLLSRFELTADQAKVLFVTEERQSAGINRQDKEFLDNPYLIYEETRGTQNPVSVLTVDRGLYPDENGGQSAKSGDVIWDCDGPLDARRIRALAIHVLERAAGTGHTLLSQSDLVIAIRELPMRPPCPLTGDSLTSAEDAFPGAISLAEMHDDSKAYQLTRLREMGDVIRSVIKKRIGGKRFTTDVNWRTLLDQKLGKSTSGDEMEERARNEKASAIAELYASRFSILIGPAGTGKTTLLSVLCEHPEIATGGVLLLAPTGKARVRMEEATRSLELRAFTIAQFLSESGRYDGETQSYRLMDNPATMQERTVIVDEASMLTEDMLGALLDALSGVHRLILVGDHRQLPPIGPGRPFVDTVRFLAPENLHALFPRVAKGYAELTIQRRQSQASSTDVDYEDVRLAHWFSGEPIEPGEDGVFDTDPKGERLKFVRWETAEDLEKSLTQVLVDTLQLKDANDIEGFEVSLGGSPYNGAVYFHPKRNGQDAKGAGENAENWQILAPRRGMHSGVVEVNRTIHKRFRQKRIDEALTRFRKTPRPAGPEEIVYGDKVICIANHRRRSVFPKDGATCYVANGEIGVVVGQFNGKNAPYKGLPWCHEVEFSSQPSFKYSFTARDFDDEGNPTLELAYALTVHKAQGSQFGTVILVVPNPCLLLSRELLYTALTRQTKRVVILHQGERAALKKYASEVFSETASRLTNLFAKPQPVKVNGRFLEEGLIHRTCDGTPVRSKSEVIIYDQLVSHKLRPVYEKALTLGGLTRYPDFTVEDEDAGLTYYWEHCGMLHDAGYRARWEEKLDWYRANGVLPLEEGGGPNGTLIITKDGGDGSFSSQSIVELIQKVFTFA